MSELRKKQKQKRVENIINAALELIGEKGYRITTIEEIAEKAEVGPATIYNYFGSKYGIITHIFSSEMTSMLEKGEKVLAALPESAEEGGYRLLMEYYGDIAERYSKKLMREIFAAALIEQLSARKELMDMDFTVMNQFGTMLEVYKSRAQLNVDIDIPDMVFTMYSLLMSDLLMFFMDDEMSVQALFEAIRHHVHFIFNGLLVKKNR